MPPKRDEHKGGVQPAGEALAARRASSRPLVAPNEGAAAAGGAGLGAEAPVPTIEAQLAGLRNSLTQVGLIKAQVDAISKQITKLEAQQAAAAQPAQGSYFACVLVRSCCACLFRLSSIPLRLSHNRARTTQRARRR